MWVFWWHAWGLFLKPPLNIQQSRHQRSGSHCYHKTQSREGSFPLHGSYWNKTCPKAELGNCFNKEKSNKKKITPEIINYEDKPTSSARYHKYCSVGCPLTPLSLQWTTGLIHCWTGNVKTILSNVRVDSTFPFQKNTATNHFEGTMHHLDSPLGGLGLGGQANSNDPYYRFTCTLGYLGIQKGEFAVFKVNQRLSIGIHSLDVRIQNGGKIKEVRIIFDNMW